MKGSHDNPLHGGIPNTSLLAYEVGEKGKSSSDSSFQPNDILCGRGKVAFTHGKFLISYLYNVLYIF